MFSTGMQGLIDQLRLHASVLVDVNQSGLMINFTVLCRNGRNGTPVARIAVTPEAIEHAKRVAIEKGPGDLESFIAKRFDVLAKPFAVLGWLDDEPGPWTERNRLQIKNRADRDAIEACLDHGDDYIVTETPQSLTSPLMMILDIKAITPGQMFLEAQQQIPDIIGPAMINHCRQMAFSDEFYEAFLHRQRFDFLIPLFRVWRDRP